jgi:hypothetical protein
MAPPVPPVAVNDNLQASLGVPRTIYPDDLFGADGSGSYNDSGSAAFTAIKITGLGTNGGVLKWFNSGSWDPVTQDQVISVADIAAGKLAFYPLNNTDASFDYKVTSDGTIYSTSAATVTIDFLLDTAASNLIDLVTNSNQYLYLQEITVVRTGKDSNITSSNSVPDGSGSFIADVIITDNPNGTGIGAPVDLVSPQPNDADNYEGVGQAVGIVNANLTNYLNNYYGSSANWTAVYSGLYSGDSPIIAVNAQNVSGKVTKYFALTNDPGPIPLALATPVSYLDYCFEKNTLIATPLGERLVSSLQIGDEILTADKRTVLVKWIGRQTFNPIFANANRSLPIKICAGALGDGLPKTDLYVSTGHAMLIDGVLVHALALVNGTSITQMQRWSGDVEYYHIETENHELILANGAVAETFIDNVSRKEFDNWAEYDALYPNAAPMIELDIPRVKFARQLPQVIAKRLDAIAQEVAPEAIAA